jgi:rhodanese-related sulfurtransferase
MTTEMLNCSEDIKEYGSGSKILTIFPFEVNGLRLRDFKLVIVDVRAASDFIQGHVPQAINLPEGNWDKISGWHDECLMIIYSHGQHCPLSQQAAQIFAAYNYAVIIMDGGFAGWKEYNFPVEG